MTGQVLRNLLCAPYNLVAHEDHAVSNIRFYLFASIELIKEFDVGTMQGCEFKHSQFWRDGHQTLSSAGPIFSCAEVMQILF
jgi:hypothetical protein